MATGGKAAGKGKGKGKGGKGNQFELVYVDYQGPTGRMQHICHEQLVQPGAPMASLQPTGALYMDGVPLTPMELYRVQANMGRSPDLFIRIEVMSPLRPQVEAVIRATRAGYEHHLALREANAFANVPNEIDRTRVNGRPECTFCCETTHHCVYPACKLEHQDPNVLSGVNSHAGTPICHECFWRCSHRRENQLIKYTLPRGRGSGSVRSDFRCLICPGSDRVALPLSLLYTATATP